jgi:hypothetical protein
MKTPPDAEISLDGTRTDVRRRGDLVYRPASPWSPSVLLLLRHLERAGFAGAPRVAEPGFDEEGREMLCFIEGVSPHPHAWSEEGSAAVGELLRELHRATSSFEPPADAIWRPCLLRELVGSRPIIGHGDTGPWNILARDGVPVAFVDWETSGPMDGFWDLVQTAWLNAQLHDDDVAERVGLPELSVRARHLRRIVDGYGLSRRERSGFVDALVELAIRSAAQEAIDAHVEPHSASCEALWGITWRARGAAWMLRHRSTLENALA